MRKKLLLLYVKHHRYPRTVSFLHGLKHGFLFINGVPVITGLDKRLKRKRATSAAPNEKL